MARQLTLGLNNMNFGMENFQKPDEVYNVLVTAVSLAKVKVKLPSHKELKSTIDLSRKRISRIF